MSNQNHIHEEVDPQLEKLIGLLRPTPPRDPKAIEQNRLKFLAEVDTSIGTEISTQKKKFYQFRPKGKTNVNTIKPKFALTTVFVIAVILVFLFGGTGVTVYAAQSALPGDALYPVKTRLEQTRLSLTSEEDRVAQIHLSLAQIRLDEVEGLIQQGRFEQVGKTSAEFEQQIQLAVEALKRLAEKDPARAAELTTQMMTELSTYTKALTGMLSNLPEDVKVVVEKAIIGSESAGALDSTIKKIEFTGIVSSLTAESWIVSGRVVGITPQTEILGSISVGDMVKVHALVNTDGSLSALEIESGTVSGTANDNLNVNQNDNSNINSNENEKENTNDNSNTNGADGEHEFEFKGTVQTILPDMWVISGITVAISPETSFQGTIAVGDQVEVKAFSSSEGNLQAVVIKLKDGSSDNHGSDVISDDHSSNDNSNKNGDDHGGEIENSNDSGGDHGEDDNNHNSGDDSDNQNNGGEDGGSGGGGGDSGHDD
jgi:uncharacterized membrane protein YgcG